MYADPSKLTERDKADFTAELRKRAKRIFNLAALGFRQTLGNDRALNSLFLRLLIEANGLNNQLAKLARGSS
ncbi:MAG: hypothetical protein N3H31_04140 [Candidatus Nezhaarchaeota archaeon]|nr:hypothetical protein [Candidatus Nezhaarchaeota archaeon]